MICNRVRPWLAVSGGIAGLMAFGAVAQAQDAQAPAAAPEAAAQSVDYPCDSITIVAHTAAGGPVDTMARKIAQEIEGVTGATTTVENRPGGDGAAAISYLLTQAADGCTIGTVTSSLTFAMAKGGMPFELSDVRFVKTLNGEPTSVAVLADSPLQTLDDFVQQMKQDPEALRIGGYGAGGFHQFVLYRLQEAAGFEGTWVPFDAGNKAALALLGGHLDVAMMTPSSATAQVQNGEIRLLGISTAETSPYFADVPTFAEGGYDVVELLWRGLMVKAGTPDEVVDALQAALETIEATPGWDEFIAQTLQEKVDTRDADLMAQAETEVEQRRSFLEAGGFLAN